MGGVELPSVLLDQPDLDFGVAGGYFHLPDLEALLVHA
jgi:hypothetical protein